MRDKNLLIAILAIFCLSTTLNGSLRASESQSPLLRERAMNGLLSGINLLAQYLQQLMVVLIMVI